MSQQVCLRWNNFRSSLVNSLEILWDEDSFCDVTLFCQGQEIRCHKVILSACSLAFKSLFLKNSCQHPIVILQDVSLCDLEAILQFIYKGQVEIDQSQLKSLLKAAASLQISSLVSVSEQEAEADIVSVPQSPPTKRLKPYPTKIPSCKPAAESLSNKKRKVKTVTVSDEELPVVQLKEEPLSEDEPYCVDIYLNESGKEVSDSLVRGEDGMNCGDPLKEPQPASGNVRSESLGDNTQAFTCKNSQYPPYPCPFCCRAYSSWGFRRRHIKAMHTSSVQLPCKWCGIVQASRQDWEKHVIADHSLSRSEAEQALTVLEEAHTVLTPQVPSVDLVRDGRPRPSPDNKE